MACQGAPCPCSGFCVRFVRPSTTSVFCLFETRLFPDVNHKRDTLIVPIMVLPEPDGPLVYVPAGGLVKAIEDSDVVLEGLEIVEKDGVYNEGEMEGENAFQDSNETVDIVSTDGRSWQGKVQFRNGAVKTT